MKPMRLSSKHSSVPAKNSAALAHRIEPYLRRLAKVRSSHSYAGWESSLVLPDDKKNLARALRIAREKSSPRLKYVLVIGIGGSSLGVRAIYQALRGYADEVTPDRFPKMLFLDTTDPNYLTAVTSFLAKRVKHVEEVLIHIASKSGTTTEPIANAEVVVASLEKRFSRINNRITVATDADSPLAELADKKNIAWAEIPKFVGGRFSTLTGVGLIPLAASGINIQKLMAGARSSLDACLEGSPRTNPAVISATTLFYHLMHGRSIHDTFLFHPELEALGKWYRGLLAESVGKEKNLSGTVVHTGMTPTVSIGSVDLHGVGQLTFGGPRDKITTFVARDRMIPGPGISDRTIFRACAPNIRGKSTGEILQAIYTGTKRAYAKNGLPFMEVLMRDISEYSLGAFMQWKMVEVIVLGKLMGLNAFDQPNVESYKAETRRILGQ